MGEGRVSGSIYRSFSNKTRAVKHEEYLIVDQTPLLKQSMNSHDGTDIASQVASASCDCKIFLGIEPISVDHEVPVVFVHSRSFASIAAVKEFREGLFFNMGNLVHIKPRAVARQNDRLFPLRYQVCACRTLYGIFCLLLRFIRSFINLLGRRTI